jgi:hypothetical protein
MRYQFFTIYIFSKQLTSFFLRDIHSSTFYFSSDKPNLVFFIKNHNNLVPVVYVQFR